MIRSLLFCVLAALSICIASAGEPLKVYILAGQSNMEGHAHLRVVDYLGDFEDTAPVLEAIRSEDGEFRPVEDTWISYLTGIRGGGNQVVSGQLIAGYGSLGGQEIEGPGEKIGPELSFGLRMQEELDQPILIIKTAWGGKSLNVDFRSPSSGPYEAMSDDARKRFEEQPEKLAEVRERTGAHYRYMVDHVRAALGDLESLVPNYDEADGYELAGFAWFQGWNDMVDRGTYPERDQPGGYDKYSEWMANFIRDVRKDLDAPEMPFVIGVMGVGGEQSDAPQHHHFRAAMAAPADMEEFEGTVAAVPTAPYWDEALAAIDEKRRQIGQKRYHLQRQHAEHENADGSMSDDDIRAFIAKYETEVLTPEDLALEERGKSNAGYHYLGSARTMVLIGDALAEALVELQAD